MKLRDWYCCQGGAGMGYSQAGFEIVGIDIEPQPRYPFEFIRGNALQDDPQDADAIHASPPCQFASKAQRIMNYEHPNLIPSTRLRLKEIGLPYIIENVEEARHHLVNPIMLCGAMFGHQTYRHRYFEISGFHVPQPPHPEHTAPLAKMGRPKKPGEYAHYVGNFSGVQQAREDMEMPWANRDGLREAIPPSYTRYIGKYLADHLC